MPPPVHSDAGVVIFAPETALPFGRTPLHHASGTGPVPIDINQYIADQRHRMWLALVRQKERLDRLPALYTALYCVFRLVGPAQPNLKHTIRHVEIGGFLSPIIPNELGITVDEVRNCVAALNPFQPLQVHHTDIRHDLELRRQP